MDLKSLVWLFIFLTLSTSISSNPEANSNTRSRDLKETRESHSQMSITTHDQVKNKACSTKDKSLHAVEIQILNEYGNRILPFNSKKGPNKKAEGRILAGHHAPPSSSKNRATSLYRPSSFIASVFLFIVAFAFFILAL